MKKTIIGELYHQIEQLGGKKYAHIGFRDPDNKFGQTLEKMVPKAGMVKKAKITIELIEE